MTEEEWIEFIRTMTNAEHRGVLTYTEGRLMMSMITKMRNEGY